MAADDKYVINEKQANFFYEKMREFVDKNELKGIRTEDDVNSLKNKNFEFLLDEMFKSDDSEIKVGLSRCMMFLGFNEMISLFLKAQIMSMISSK